MLLSFVFRPSNAVLIIQRSYRSLCGRRRLEARRQLIEADEKHGLKVQWQLVLALLQALSSAKKHAKKILKPVTGRFTTVMDDQTVVASVSR